MNRPGKLVVPSEAEDARIMRGIGQDDDAWIPSDADWARAEPGRERDPGLEDALTAMPVRRRLGPTRSMRSPEKADFGRS